MVERRSGIAGVKEIYISTESAKAGEDLTGAGMPRQMGRRVDNIADQIKPARFNIAFRE